MIWSDQGSFPAALAFGCFDPCVIGWKTSRAFLCQRATDHHDQRAEALF